MAGQRFNVVLNLVPTSPEQTAELAGLVARVDAGDLRIEVDSLIPATRLPEMSAS